MSRVNLEGDRIADFLIERGFKFGSQSWVPANNAVIDPSMPPLLIVNPAGAVNLLMPPSNAANKGLAFIICNASGSTVTLQTSAGAGFTTAIVLLTIECTMVVCTGDATAGLGWRALGTASSA